MKLILFLGLFAVLAPVVEQETYKLKALTVVNGGGSTSDSGGKIDLAGTPLGGRTKGSTGTILFGPASMRDFGSLVPRAILISSIGNKTLTMTWDKELLDRHPAASLLVLRSQAENFANPDVVATLKGNSHTFAAENGEPWFYALKLDSSSAPASAGFPAITTANLIDGDVNGDGVTDWVDLVEMAHRYGANRTTDDPTWFPSADADANGTVDDADLAKLIGSFGHVYAQ